MNSLCTIFWSIALFCTAFVAPDPQTYLVNSGCNNFEVTNQTVFLENINQTFSDLRSQLSVNNTRFATAMNARFASPVYGVVQCRNYMTRSDCLECYAAAQVQIRTCFFSNGAHVFYDGCHLRYEPSDFFQDTDIGFNSGFCGDRPISQETTSIVGQFLSDLVAATPRMDEYFAASIRQVGEGMNIYAVAQCMNIISRDRCSQCLNTAYNNLVSCQTFTEGRAVDVRCFLRFSDEAFFTNNQTTDITSFLSEGGSNNNAIIIGGAVGGVGLLLVLVVVGILWLKKSRKKGEGDIFASIELKDLLNYKYKDLQSATNNFSKENKLGEGGFGDVYKATLKNGNVVAVKRLVIAQIARAKEQFESEMKLISNVHHRNLLRLLGGCSKRQELLLVYEYMANSSLDKFIFGDKIGTLDWKHRLNVIIGTAKGLAYMHEECNECIIHRDIKSSNILLDEDLQPKIADFGLARLLPNNQSHVNTRFAGTLGYMAPEYAIHGRLSPKVDTYSYGVVVLEIISGRKSNDVKLEPSAQYLVEWAWRLYEDDKVMELVDKSLDLKQYEIVEIKKVIDIALLCTQSLVESRPTMSEVVVRLS